MQKIIVIILFLSASFGAIAQNLTGTASFYHAKFNGRKTATGEIFSNSKMTCACNRLPLNTNIKVTNIQNGKSVIVRVNDRLAANNKRLVDLSQSAAQQLGFVNSGLCKVRVEVVEGGNTKSKRKKKNKDKNPNNSDIEISKDKES
jgi:rare lipoprotein A